MPKARWDIRARAVTLVNDRDRLNCKENARVQNELRKSFHNVQISTIRSAVAWAIRQNRSRKKPKA